MENDTLFHRHIHPSLIQNDTVSYQAFLASAADIASSVFIPSMRDEKKLSVYNGEVFSPKDSFDHYTQQLKSKGCLSVSKSECESIEPLIVINDNIPFKGHSYVDFTAVTPDTKNVIRAKAIRLREFAVKRNWTFIK